MIFKNRRIYMDTAATTPVDLKVLGAMLPYFSAQAGNPSSLHKEGVIAHSVLENARKKIAELIEAHPDEIIFTSGGTEGDNLAIIGVARGLLAKNKIKAPGHIITTVIEHQAVLDSCHRLEKEGWAVTYLPVSKDGIVDLVALKEALRPETVLVSVMYANNEIGAIQPLREIAKILREHRKLQNRNNSTTLASTPPLLTKEGINPHLAKAGWSQTGAVTDTNRLPYFHTDACQAPRFLPLTVEKLGIDLITLNGSKIYGPKGIGCLFVKRNTFLEPIMYGGGQERGVRSGTENVPGVIGLAKALELATSSRERESEFLTKLRDYFVSKLREIEGVIINGGMIERLPNNINVTFIGILGEWMVLSLDARGIACSTGSACSSNHKDNSHVIKALGHNNDYAESTVRFTLDRTTTKKDIDFVLKNIKEILAKNIK
jgi:cysteine desulfurase